MSQPSRYGARSSAQGVVAVPVEPVLRDPAGRAGQQVRDLHPGVGARVHQAYVDQRPGAVPLLHQQLAHVGDPARGERLLLVVDEQDRPAAAAPVPDRGDQGRDQGLQPRRHPGGVGQRPQQRLLVDGVHQARRGRRPPRRRAARPPGAGTPRP